MPSREFKPKWVDSTIKSYQVSQVQFESATITLIINTHLLYLYGHLQGFGPTSNKFWTRGMLSPCSYMYVFLFFWKVIHMYYSLF